LTKGAASLRNDRALDHANISQHVIKGPSGAPVIAEVNDWMDVLHGGMEEQEGANAAIMIQNKSRKLRSLKCRR
jgi:hypothetical protein